MVPRVNAVWNLSKDVIVVSGYTLLALFMLLLAYMTTQYGGPLTDWKSIVTVLALAMLCVIVAWLAVTAWRER